MVSGENGRAVFAPATFGVDGPRWFLRGVLSGRAAIDDDAAAPLLEVLRAAVVVRGTEPMAPRELLPLALPREAERRRRGLPRLRLTPKTRPSTALPSTPSREGLRSPRCGDGPAPTIRGPGRGASNTRPMSCGTRSDGGWWRPHGPGSSASCLCVQHMRHHMVFAAAAQRTPPSSRRCWDGNGSVNLVWIGRRSIAEERAGHVPAGARPGGQGARGADDLQPGLRDRADRVSAAGTPAAPATPETVEALIRHRLSTALGGWRGSIETALPTVVFGRRLSTSRTSGSLPARPWASPWCSPWCGWRRSRR